MTDQDDPKTKAKSAANDLRDDLSHKAQDFASDARETAQSLASDARRSAYEYGTGVKDHAASETSKLANALRGAAGDLQDGSVQERLVGRLAENVADAADGLREQDIDDLGRDFSEFARRNPLAFLGGAALLGFAAGRFLKATGGSHDDMPDPSRSYAAPRPVHDGPSAGGEFSAHDEYRAHASQHAGADPTPSNAKPSRPLTSYNGSATPNGHASGARK